MQDRFETRHGAVTIKKQEQPRAVFLVFDDASTVQIGQGDAVKLNLSPDTLPYTCYPAKAARLIEDMRDYCALEMEYPDEVKAIVQNVFDFFGITRSDSTERPTRPLDWTKEGMKRRLSRRSY